MIFKICEDSLFREATRNKWYKRLSEKLDIKTEQEALTTVFVDTRLRKTKRSRKRFQNFRQSYVLLTDRIEIHQSQPLA